MDDRGTATPPPARSGARHAAVTTTAWWVRLVSAVWFWPALAMLGLGLWRIGPPELWQDELVTVEVGQRSLGDIVALVRQVDGVHGAYYVFMHLWIGLFGDSTVALRLPSVLAMTGAAAGVALIGARLFSRGAGVAAGLVFALIPAISRFAHETRSYAFVLLAGVLATLFLLRALERDTAVSHGSRPRSAAVARWAAYGVSVAALVSLNAVSTALVVGHGAGLVVWLWGRWSWRPVISFVGAGLGAALLASPVLYLGRKQAATQILWIQHEGVLPTWAKTVNSTLAAGALVLLAVLPFALLALRRRLDRALVFGAVITLVPLLLVKILSMGEINYFFSKYLMFVLPGFALLAGAGVTALRWRPAAVILVAAFALVGLPDQVAVRGDLAHAWYTYPAARVPADPISYRDAARAIAAGYQPGDGIAYQRGGLWWRMLDIGVGYYLPSSVTPRDVFLSPEPNPVAMISRRDCLDPAACLGDEARVWVVVAGRVDDVLAELDPAQAAALAGAYQVAEVTHTQGLTVALLHR